MEKVRANKPENATRSGGKFIVRQALEELILFLCLKMDFETGEQQAI